MKKDITNHEDILAFLKLFYSNVKKNESLKIFFQHKDDSDWERFSVLMAGFWENVIFYTGDYEGNPIETHRRINHIHPTTKEHFKNWEMLFEETLRKNFEGPNVERMIQHSKSIADVMKRNIKPTESQS